MPMIMTTTSNQKNLSHLHQPHSRDTNKKHNFIPSWKAALLERKRAKSESQDIPQWKLEVLKRKKQQHASEDSSPQSHSIISPLKNKKNFHSSVPCLKSSSVFYADFKDKVDKDDHEEDSIVPIRSNPIVRLDQEKRRSLNLEVLNDPMVEKLSSEIFTENGIEGEMEYGRGFVGKLLKKFNSFLNVSGFGSAGKTKFEISKTGTISDRSQTAANAINSNKIMNRNDMIINKVSEKHKITQNSQIAASVSHSNSSENGACETNSSQLNAHSKTSVTELNAELNKNSYMLKADTHKQESVRLADRNIWNSYKEEGKDEEDVFFDKFVAFTSLEQNGHSSTVAGDSRKEEEEEEFPKPDQVKLIKQVFERTRSDNVQMKSAKSSNGPASLSIDKKLPGKSISNLPDILLSNSLRGSAVRGASSDEESDIKSLALVFESQSSKSTTAYGAFSKNGGKSKSSGKSNVLPQKTSSPSSKKDSGKKIQENAKSTSSSSGGNAGRNNQNSSTTPKINSIASSKSVSTCSTMPSTSSSSSSSSKPSKPGSLLIRSSASVPFASSAVQPYKDIRESSARPTNTGSVISVGDHLDRHPAATNGYVPVTNIDSVIGSESVYVHRGSDGPLSSQRKEITDVNHNDDSTVISKASIKLHDLSSTKPQSAASSPSSSQALSSVSYLQMKSLLLDSPSHFKEEKDYFEEGLDGVGELPDKSEATGSTLVFIGEGIVHGKSALFKSKNSKRKLSVTFSDPIDDVREFEYSPEEEGDEGGEHHYNHLSNYRSKMQVDFDYGSFDREASSLYLSTSSLPSRTDHVRSEEPDDPFSTGMPVLVSNPWSSSASVDLLF